MNNIYFKPLSRLLDEIDTQVSDIPDLIAHDHLILEQNLRI